MNLIKISLLVGFGGFAGSLSRYALSILFRSISLDWPWGTFSANILGCLLLGMIMSLSEFSELISPEARLCLATGFCGGFTTLSTLIYESNEMFKSGEYYYLTFYFFGTLICSAVAFILGSLIIKSIFKLGGSGL